MINALPDYVADAQSRLDTAIANATASDISPEQRAELMAVVDTWRSTLVEAKRRAIAGNRK
jgi:hypothetical protein